MQLIVGDRDPKCQHGIFLQTRPHRIGKESRKMYRSSLHIDAKYNVQNSAMFFQYRNQAEDLRSFLFPTSKQPDWHCVNPPFWSVLVRAAFIPTLGRQL